MIHAESEGFNQLHAISLKSDGTPLGTFRTVSVRKKCYGNYRITPLHCACINPDTKYLSELTGSIPGFRDWNLGDAEDRKLIHYAAACSSTEPLKFLFENGKSLVVTFDLDKNGVTPLMVACRTGRLENVKLLLERDRKWISVRRCICPNIYF